MKEPLFHVQYPHEVFQFAQCEVEDLAFDLDLNSNPAWSIQDFGEILRISVLPPSHTGLIRIINTCYITTQVRFA